MYILFLDTPCIFFSDTPCMLTKKPSIDTERIYIILIEFHVNQWCYVMLNIDDVNVEENHARENDET